MGEMEFCVIEGREQNHKAIITAINDFAGLGYLIKDIAVKDGAIEVACYAPQKKEAQPEN